MGGLHEQSDKARRRCVRCSALCQGFYSPILPTNIYWHSTWPTTEGTRRYRCGEPNN